MRFCGFQNVTINLPACAYRSSSISDMYDEMEQMLDLVIKAHKQKRAIIEKLMAPGRTMWEVARPRPEFGGEPYVDLDKAVYIVGIIGLNEAVKSLTGKEMHEDEDAYNTGLQIIMKLYKMVQEKAKENNMKMAIEETPAESTTRRLAKLDLEIYPNAITQGTKEDPYYTNSVHLRADADIDPIERLEKQGLFHPLVESGAVVHLFVGEKWSPWQSIRNLIEKTWYNTSANQMTITPTYTICSRCGKVLRGIASECKCGQKAFKTIQMEVL